MAQDRKPDSGDADFRRSVESGVEAGDDRAESAIASRNYWSGQSRALGKIRNQHANWTEKRRALDRETGKTWKRVSYTLPRAEAQEKAREFLRKYPKAAYWSEVESWRELPGNVIEFTMRRLPTAD